MSDTFRNLFSGQQKTTNGGPLPASDDGAVGAGSAPAQRSQEVRPDMAPGAVLRVLGAGGGGSNAVQRMVNSKLPGVEFIAVNTDVQALYHNPAATKVTIGRGITRGLGAGSDPGVGKRAAEESLEEIKGRLDGTDMLFVTAGLGGGTGSGSVPIITELARGMGILTVGVVTMPFSFEGVKRKKNAEEALENMKGKVDTLIKIPNDKILSLIDKTTPLTEAFQVVDEVLQHAIEGISSLITQHGLVNVDFADVKTIMQDAGTSLMGIGYGTGDSRASEAARAAVDSPLLDMSIDGASGILFNVTGGTDLSMFEVDEAARIITETAAPDSNIIFGAVIDENYTGQVKVTVVATGFDHKEGENIPASLVQKHLQKSDAPPLPEKSFMSTDVFTEEKKSEDLVSAAFTSSNPDLNEEELEVPAFMRKQVSK
jgi:cell division protein FtsZ